VKRAKEIKGKWYAVYVIYSFTDMIYCRVSKGNLVYLESMVLKERRVKGD